MIFNLTCSLKEKMAAMSITAVTKKQNKGYITNN